MRVTPCFVFGCGGKYAIYISLLNLILPLLVPLLIDEIKESRTMKLATDIVIT